VSAGPALAPDAAIVLGIASTALPFAGTPGDAAERWLRVLRLHGEAGAALQALGVSEGPLRPPDERERASDSGEGDRDDAVARVLEHAIRRADLRGADGVATSDVLMAVMDVYGADFDRVLRAHGTDRDEVIERLAEVG
jgi:hypothetical protein